MAKNGHNIAHGVISGIVLIAGIILCIVVSVGVHKVEKLFGNWERPFGNDGLEVPERERDDFRMDSEEHEHRHRPGHAHHHEHHRRHHGFMMLWAVGFAYILPGLFGVISAFTKKKGVYITHMVFSIMTLLVMGIAFVVGVVALGSLAVSHPNQCTPLGEKCQCTSEDMYEPLTLEMTCDNLHCLYVMCIIVVLVVVSGWILTLVSTILSGVLICRRESAGGVVIQKTPMAPAVIHSSVLGFGDGEKKGLPQTHDAAKLVTNMEI
ncbi:uncharacterized protein LOC124256369 [Haliotis rubra]|uniref:uncharacterized protein LOC124256369 n=1 Tax=Haliotis rubra TaxID=36100 RepID=UPI001EE5134B|nr:uncharacterized protein LOC124256369 [Haliotis rubra]